MLFGIYDVKTAKLYYYLLHKTKSVHKFLENLRITHTAILFDQIKVSLNANEEFISVIVFQTAEISLLTTVPTKTLAILNVKGLNVLRIVV